MPDKITFCVLPKLTSRDRPKSAPYLRLKNSRRTSKCQSIGESGPFYEKKFLKKSLTMPKKTERGTLWDFSTFILSRNSKKIEGDPLRKKIPEKKSRIAKKTERGTLWSRPVLHVTREFLVQFLEPTGTIWGLVKSL